MVVDVFDGAMVESAAATVANSRHVSWRCTRKSNMARLCQRCAARRDNGRSSEVELSVVLSMTSTRVRTPHVLDKGGGGFSRSTNKQCEERLGNRSSNARTPRNSKLGKHFVFVEIEEKVQ